MASTPRWVRPAAFLTAALLFAFVMTDRGLEGAYRMGLASGSAGVALAVVGLGIGWRRSMRKHIPLGTLLLVVPLSMGDSTRESDPQAMEADLVAIREMIQDPWATPADADRAYEGGSTARSVRALRRAAEDLAGWMRSLAGDYGVDPDREPDEWLSNPYLADAGRHPEVGDYYGRYCSYLRHVRREFMPRLDSLARHHLEQAALSARSRRAFLGGMQSSLGPSFGSLDATEQLCRDVAALHTFLVRVDPHVHLEPDGTVRFENPLERKQANVLVKLLRTDAARLEQAQAEARRRGAAAFDRLRGMERTRSDKAEDVPSKRS